MLLKEKGVPAAFSCNRFNLSEQWSLILLRLYNLLYDLFIPSMWHGRGYISFTPIVLTFLILTGICLEGTYSENGVEPCMLCPKGEFQNKTGQSRCQPCPGLQSTPGEGTTSLKACISKY